MLLYHVWCDWRHVRTCLHYWTLINLVWLKCELRRWFSGTWDEWRVVIPCCWVMLAATASISVDVGWQGILHLAYYNKSFQLGNCIYSSAQLRNRIIEINIKWLLIFLPWGPESAALLLHYLPFLQIQWQELHWPHRKARRFWLLVSLAVCFSSYKRHQLLKSSIDYGWTGWAPSPDNFCFEVMPQLEAAGITVPNEVINDCDPGDKQYITNATALQSKPTRLSKMNTFNWLKLVDTSSYVGQVCALKNCSAFVGFLYSLLDSANDHSSPLVTTSMTAELISRRVAFWDSRLLG